MQANRQRTNHNSALEHLSVEELEQLLYTPDGKEPDVDFMTEVLEVIHAKEANDPSYTEPDVDAAWADFKENYMEQAEIYGPADEEPLNSRSKRKGHNVLILLRRTVAVAAILAAFCVTASAFGFDILKAIADWTAETFQFASLDDIPVEQSIRENDPYAELRAAVSEETALSVVPTWAPGDIIQERVSIDHRSNSVSICGTYQTDSYEYTVTIMVYENWSDAERSSYQKDDQEVEKHVVNDITHYLMRNTEYCTAAWVNENVEVSIQGTLSFADLNSMINSVYWE